MPPRGPHFASKFRGLVCQSCLSEFRFSTSQRPPWLSRSFASDRTGRPRRDSKPLIRIWDETPDGKRTPWGVKPSDEAMLHSLQQTIQDVREEMEAEAGSKEIDEEELHDRALAKHINNNLLQGGDLEGNIVARMEAEMEELDAKVDKRLENVDMNSMSEEERSKFESKFIALSLIDSMKERKFDPEPLSSSDPIEPTPEPEFKHPNQEPADDLQRFLTPLIYSLQFASSHLDTGRIDKRFFLELWNLYEQSRETLLSRPRDVPDEVWQSLWDISTVPEFLNFKYLKRLGQDMTDASVPLQNWQRLFYIQAIFTEGESDIAIKHWEGLEGTLGRNNDTSTDYWKLGASMYTRHGELKKALGAADVLIQHTNDPAEFRVLIPIMEAFLASNEDRKKQRAWALYVRLKLGLGPQMEMKDYDAVASMFFKANSPDLALGVFRDMMLTGDASAKQYDSAARYANGPAIQSDLDLISIADKEVNWDDPRILAKLPANFNNKFFFGKWIKKLIGEGELDASIKVFNLMNDRGISPDAKYVNGLIGAWLRTGKARNHTLAEDTAWMMIQERLKVVENRRTRSVLSYPLRGVDWDDKPATKLLSHHPQATIETFTLLIEDYRRRQKHDRMRDLLKTLEQAEIRPNTDFMNQLMRLKTEIPQHYAWDTYTYFTQTQGVQPDFDTYGQLWFLTKRVVDPNLNPAQYPKIVKEIPNTDVPRLLFAEMANWAPKLTSKGRRLPRELYDMIILSFSLAQDQPGTAVALRALQRHFKMFPNEDTVRTIVYQLARTGLENKKNEYGRSVRRRVRFSVKKSPVARERVAQVTKLLEGFKARRVDELLQQGVIFDQLGRVERLEESLILMTNLLRHVTQIRMEEGQDVAGLFQTAAREMGVLNCVS